MRLWKWGNNKVRKGSPKKKGPLYTGLESLGKPPKKKPEKQRCKGKAFSPETIRRQLAGLP